jgi:hypothetical protein
MSPAELDRLLEIRTGSEEVRNDERSRAFGDSPFEHIETRLKRLQVEVHRYRHQPVPADGSRHVRVRDSGQQDLAPSTSANSSSRSSNGERTEKQTRAPSGETFSMVSALRRSSLAQRQASAA